MCLLAGGVGVWGINFLGNSGNFPNFLPQKSSIAGVKICNDFLGSCHFPDFLTPDPNFHPGGRGVGIFFTFESFPDVSAYACQIWSRSDGRVEKDLHTHIHTHKQRDSVQLYIVDWFFL